MTAVIRSIAVTIPITILAINAKAAQLNLQLQLNI